jgi:hypothetical protein
MLDAGGCTASQRIHSKLIEAIVIYSNNLVPPSFHRSMDGSMYPSNLKDSISPSLESCHPSTVQPIRNVARSGNGPVWRHCDGVRPAAGEPGSDGQAVYDGAVPRAGAAA